MKLLTKAAFGILAFVSLSANAQNAILLGWSDPGNSGGLVVAHRIYWRTNGALEWQYGTQFNRVSTNAARLSWPGWSEGTKWDFVLTHLGTSAGLAGMSESVPSPVVTAVFGSAPATPVLQILSIEATIKIAFPGFTNWITSTNVLK